MHSRDSRSTLCEQFNLEHLQYITVDMSCTSSRKTQSGTLAQLHGNVVLPSTLNYKERIELRKNDAYQYGRIYNHTNTRGMSVYDRLTADASVRQTLKSVTEAAAPPSDNSSFAAMAQAAATAAATAAVADMGRSCSRPASNTISGFVSNNNLCPASNQQALDTAPPLSALHPITLRSYYKKFPVDFLAAARPKAHTTNETMRMLGTYSSDQAVAQRLGVQIPHGCSCAALTHQ